MNIISRCSELLLKVLLMFLVSGCSEPEKPVIETLKRNPNAGTLAMCGSNSFPDTLMAEVFHSARLVNGDYMVVLSMGEVDPDSAFRAVLDQVRPISNQPCYKLNFGEEDLLNSPKLDSLKNAKLIYICGGENARILNIFRNTPMHQALKDAYESGSTVAATGEAASWLGKIVITGEENFSETEADTYNKVWSGNAIYAEGFGLLDSTIVDHHFVTRSRYNRLITSLCDYQGMAGLGIDDNTAVFVSGPTAMVRGSGQVVHFRPGMSCNVRFQTMKMSNARIDMPIAGDRFSIK